MLPAHHLAMLLYTSKLATCLHARMLASFCHDYCLAATLNAGKLGMHSMYALEMCACALDL